MPNSEMLGVVEDMARRLLTEEEVAAVMKTCRRVRGFVHRRRRSGTIGFRCADLWTAQERVCLCFQC